ncbi:leucine-rich repeat-containing protein 31 isoform X2 [Clupea harengus]|uniref:Leucine-rich repeat-containing protein 31 isoform X2 n=1 Tax=Clupea harengus TaxID=7950 RepID=A0A8M1KQ21_CLUHA|nr:leucine-rich repeat-containing protein 31 isoform X2 [Clupea harengus]
MESSDAQRSRDGSQKRSAIDLIMNQIRRKTSFTERRQKPVGFLFRPGENNDRKNGGIPEMKESDNSEGKNTESENTDSVDTEVGSVVGWGRVKQFVEKLGKKPDSQTLSLSHCDLTATDVLELATLLTFLTQLEELDLSWNDLVGGSLKALTFHLQHVGKLRGLRLCGCRLTAQDLTALGESLDSVPLLEIVDLSWNAGVGGAGLRSLTSQLRYGCMIRELRLVDCQLTDADIKALGQALPLMTNLEDLDLSCNRIATGGVRELFSSLNAAHGLRSLTLHMCGLEQDDLCILGEALQFFPTLQRLDLSANKGASGGLAKMTKSLAQMTHLSGLDIHLCCLTEEDAIALVQVIPSLSALKELDVSSNKKIGDCLQSLLSVLPLPVTRRLLLNNCGLSADSYQALGSAVPSLSQLERLNVSWSKSVGGNLKLLLGGLPCTSCKLQDLRLSSCDLTTEDVLHLASASKRGVLSQVKRLDLSYNGGVGDSGWVALFGEGAGGLRALEELDVSLRPSSSPPPASPWLPALLEAVATLPSLAHVALQHWVLRQDERDKLENIMSKKRHAGM